MKYVQSQIKLPIDSVVLFTDSQCVLQWISSKKKLPVFIENRVSEIRKHDVIFRYVNTKENPADIATRGCDVANLDEHSLWWHGPEWLLRPVDEWTNPLENTSDSVKNVMPTNA